MIRKRICTLVGIVASTIKPYQGFGSERKRKLKHHDLITHS